MLTKSQVEAFEQVRSQISALHQEISALAKKTPDMPINKFKLAIVNEKLSVANELLEDTYRPMHSFELFDDAQLPTASDVVTVLALYLDALEGWRSAHLVFQDFDWLWDTKEKNYHTDAPTRFRTKRIR